MKYIVPIIFILFNCIATKSQCEKGVDYRARNSCMEAIENRLFFTGDLTSKEFPTIADQCLIIFLMQEEDRSDCSKSLKYIPGL
jgi:hypothetical protein